VNATYRLAPQHKWPAAAEDVGAAVRWVGSNIAVHGGDPARVVLMGHSAGAVHVASYIAHPQFHGSHGIGVAGAIFISGIYDIGPATAHPAYFGDDASKFAERSPLPGLLKSKLPLMVVVAEFDPQLFASQAKILKDALCKETRCPRHLHLPKHSHMSEVYAINTKDASLSSEILTFVKAI
jgi:acetyl esterase/lipase